MSNPWPKVRFGDVMQQRKANVSVDPTGTYQFAGVYCFGRGVFRGQERAGSEFAYSTLSQVQAGEFIYPKLMAWEGAFGVVPASCDGCYVSPEFPVFEIDATRLDSRFLSAYFKIPRVWEAVSGGSSGTNVRRRRLNSSDFLQREMPLPPLAEQRRIAARVDELSAQISEARSLRQQAAKDAEVLYPQIRDKLFRELKCERKPIGEIFDLINGRAFKPEEWQEQGRKIVRIQNLKYSNATYNRFSGQVDPKHLIHIGDVLFAWSGQVVSLGAHIWRDEEAILNQHIFNVRARSDFLPEFVKEGFNALVDEMKEQVRGLEMFHIRKQEVVKLRFPVPPPPEQRRIVAELDLVQTEASDLKRLQAETAAELAALLPALLDRAFHGEL